MRLVTVATHSDGYFPWLIESCRRNTVKLDVLGWKQKWQGFNWRNKLMIDYLKQLPPQELVCFIDAYDVIILKQLTDMEPKFAAFTAATGYKIVVGCEHIKDSYSKLGAALYFPPCKGTYLNAGTYMGLAKDLLEILQEIYTKNNNPKADDQKLLSAYCNINPHNVYIDANNLFFLTIVNFNRNIDQYVPHYSSTPSSPFILHCNNYTRMDNVLKSLDYSFTSEDQTTINRYIIRSMTKKYGYIYAIIFVIIFIIILTIIFKLQKNK